jgi:hypothetical protein
MHYHLIVINDCQARGEECQEDDQEDTSQHLEIFLMLLLKFFVFLLKNLVFRLTCMRIKIHFFTLTIISIRIRILSFHTVRFFLHDETRDYLTIQIQKHWSASLQRTTVQ